MLLSMRAHSVLGMLLPTRAYRALGILLPMKGASGGLDDFAHKECIRCLGCFCP